MCLPAKKKEKIPGRMAVKRPIVYANVSPMPRRRSAQSVTFVE